MKTFCGFISEKRSLSPSQTVTFFITALEKVHITRLKSLTDNPIDVDDLTIEIENYLKPFKLKHIGDDFILPHPITIPKDNKLIIKATNTGTGSIDAQFLLTGYYDKILKIEESLFTHTRIKEVFNDTVPAFGRNDNVYFYPEYDMIIEKISIIGADEDVLLNILRKSDDKYLFNEFLPSNDVNELYPEIRKEDYYSPLLINKGDVLRFNLINSSVSEKTLRIAFIGKEAW